MKSSKIKLLFLLVPVLLFFASECFALHFEIKNGPMSSFSSWVSDVTGKNIILGEGADKLVNLNISGIEQTDVWALFCAVAQGHGLEVLEKEKFILLVSTQTGAITPSGSGSTEPPEEKIFRAFALSHVQAKDILEGLRMIGEVSVLPGNILLVAAAEDKISQANKIIETLDTPKKRILIEAVICEILDQDVFELGIKMKIDSSNIQGRSNLSNLALSDLFNGSGGAVAVFKGSFSSLVNALQTSDQVRTLSTPRIVVNDGVSGRVSVGDNVPFVTGQYQTDDGKTNSFQTIERKDVGLSLSVLPKVLSGDFVLVDVTQESSSVSPSSFASDIITKTRNIKTTVTLGPDEVLCIGGLQSEDDSKTVSGIPVLSSIPWLGRLFQYKHKELVKKTLTVFLRVRYV